MSTNAIIGVIAAIIVVGGGAWYAMHPAAPAPAAETGAAATSSEVSEGDTGTDSIAALAARGENLRCDVSVDNPTSPTKGTLEVSGGKVHGEFDTTTGGREIHSYLIEDGTYMYAWSDMAPQGVKVSVSASSGTAAGSSVDPNTKVRYSCEPWAADASLFVPPTNITFMTFGGVQ